MMYDDIINNIKYSPGLVLGPIYPVEIVLLILT